MCRNAPGAATSAAGAGDPVDTVFLSAVPGCTVCAPPGISTPERHRPAIPAWLHSSVLQNVRAATYAATLAWRHLRDEPARSPLLLLRVLPAPARAGLRRAAARGGPLLRAYALAGAGERGEAVRSEERRAGTWYTHGGVTSRSRE